MSEQKTKTVRIALLIDARGRWAATGSSYLEDPNSHGPDWEWIDEAADFDNDLVNPKRYWVTATLTLPERGEVVGAVEAEAEPT